MGMVHSQVWKSHRHKKKPCIGRQQIQAEFLPLLQAQYSHFPFFFGVWLVLAMGPRAGKWYANKFT